MTTSENFLGIAGGCWRLQLTDALVENEVVSCLYSFHGYDGYDVIFLHCVEEGNNSGIIGMMSYPCGKYEQIKPSHIFKSVNHTYIIITLDTTYQTKEKSCKFDTGKAIARCRNQTLLIDSAETCSILFVYFSQGL